LPKLSGWTSGQIAEAVGVREDTVGFWRSAFVTGGIEALRKSVAPGPAPVKAEGAWAVAEEVLVGPVADRPNWTLPRLADEIERRAGGRISSLADEIERRAGGRISSLADEIERRAGGRISSLADEIERRAGGRISSSRLSVVLRPQGISAGDGLAIR
jgi:transposase